MPIKGQTVAEPASGADDIYTPDGPVPSCYNCAQPIRPCVDVCATLGLGGGYVHIGTGSHFCEMRQAV